MSLSTYLLLMMMVKALQICKSKYYYHTIKIHTKKKQKKLWFSLGQVTCYNYVLVKLVWLRAVMEYSLKEQYIAC